MRSTELNVFYIGHPWLNVEANDGLIMAAVKPPVSLHTLDVAARAVKDRLAMRSDWLQAWQQFLVEHPEFGDDCEYVNKLMCFDLLKPGAKPCLEAFEEVAYRKPSPLALSSKFTQSQRDQELRRQLIAEISEGKTVYTARDRYGRVSRYQAADLENDSTERLIEIRDFVVSQRRLLKMSPGQAREEVSRIQKNQPVAEAPSLVLKNPETGSEYTRRELVRLMAAQDKATFRKMLFTHNGQPIPGAKEAVDRILGVKPTEQVGQRIGIKL